MCDTVVVADNQVLFPESSERDAATAAGGAA
jgi:hypothetical protein